MISRFGVVFLEAPLNGGTFNTNKIRTDYQNDDGGHSFIYINERAMPEPEDRDAIIEESINRIVNKEFNPHNYYSHNKSKYSNIYEMLDAFRKEAAMFIFDLNEST